MPYPPDHPQSFAVRLSELLADAVDGKAPPGAPASQAEISRRYGMRPATVSDYLSGKFKPRAEKVRRMAADYAVHFDWLYFGKGPKNVGGVEQYAAEKKEAQPTWRNSPEEFHVRQLDVAAAMGDGAIVADHVDVVKHIAVSLAQLRRQVNFSSPQNLSFITGYGTSMEPTFSDGDILLVDEGVRVVDIDAVFVFLLNGRLYVKTLQRTPTGSLVMISDNKRYLPYEIKSDDAFEVQGRVLLAWNAKRL